MKKQEFPERGIQHNDSDLVVVYEFPEIYVKEALEKISRSPELRKELTELHENHYPNHRLILGMKGEAIVIVGMMEKRKDAMFFMWHHFGLIGSENILPLKPLRQERMTVEDVEELAATVEHPGFICFKEGEKKPFIIKSKAFKKMRNFCRLYLGDSREALKEYENQVNLIMTSPPHADARKNLYGGVSPEEFPEWFATFHESFWNVLTDDGSLVINIKDKVVDGMRNRYVWKTIEKLSDLGWKCIDDFIWNKTNPVPGYWPNRLRDGWNIVSICPKQQGCFSMPRMLPCQSASGQRIMIFRKPMANLIRRTIPVTLKT